MRYASSLISASVPSRVIASTPFRIPDDDVPEERVVDACRRGDARRVRRSVARQRPTVRQAAGETRATRFGHRCVQLAERTEPHRRDGKRHARASTAGIAAKQSYSAGLSAGASVRVDYRFCKC